MRISHRGARLSGMHYRNARAVFFFICAVLCPLQAAAIDSASASYRNTRSSVDSSGRRKTSASYRADGAAGEISAPSGTSASYSKRDGLEGDDFYPGRATGVWASSGASAGTVYLQWNAPGNDGDENSTAGKFVVRCGAIAAQSPALSDALFNAAADVTPAPPVPSVRGTLMSMTATGLTPGVTYYCAVKAAERDGLRSVLSLGATAQAAVGPAPTAVTLTAVGLSSATVSFGAVGANGYVVQASSASDFSYVLYSSNTTTGATVLAPQGLDPNTTYYLRAGSLWGGTTVYAGTALSTSTLAQLVSGATVYQVNVTSIIVNWLPLSLSPPAPSSMSATGYELQVSSRSDFTPLWTSSNTPNVLLSTLAVSGLTGGVTYYFRVGSLNWDGAVDYANWVSTTLLPIQLGVMTTTTTVPLSATQPMGTTVVISTSIVLTNTGNVSETYLLRATTATAGSQWTIGASPWQDRFSAWTVVNSTAAGTTDFNAAAQLADAFASCAPANFTMGNSNCVQVPVGGTRTIWVKIAMPLTTSDKTNASQNIQVTAKAVKDP
jgi:hypothetical protein